MNASLARRVIELLYHHGVREFCVCPGGRNVPLVQLLAASDALGKFHFFDERAAAFFALGRIRSTQRPVVVITTSGTAAGELLPAVMEAHYSGLPLILLTADRPRAYRGTGAPQVAEQVDLFGCYAEASVDCALDEALEVQWSRARPLHINVCFDEPLLESSPPGGLRFEPASPTPLTSTDYSAARAQLHDFLLSTRRPLVIVGGLAQGETAAVQRFLCELGAPVYAEAQSRLRESGLLAPFKMTIGDRLLARLRAHGWNVDGVLRIGQVPTHRIWRDLEVAERSIPVLSLSALPFSGMTRARLIHAPLDVLLHDLRPPRSVRASLPEGCVGEDLRLRAGLDRLCEQEPCAEQAILHWLSRRIPAGSDVFIGNSLPIRHWDLAATTLDRNLTTYASRGLNGIDGQISTFLGMSRPERGNWGIFGDLTALYDMNAPWILREHVGLRAQIVVINNAGGRIFERMFPALPQCLNRHALSFEPLAQLWNLAYALWTKVPDDVIDPRDRLIEVHPDPAATRRFADAYEAML